jgi:hypothetical protein
VRARTIAALTSHLSAAPTQWSTARTTTCSRSRPAPSSCQRRSGRSSRAACCCRYDQPGAMYLGSRHRPSLQFVIRNSGSVRMRKTKRRRARGVRQKAARRGYVWMFCPKAARGLLGGWGTIPGRGARICFPGICPQKATCSSGFESLLAPVGPDRRVLSASRAVSLSFTTVYYPFYSPASCSPQHAPGPPILGPRPRSLPPCPHLTRLHRSQM